MGRWENKSNLIRFVLTTAALLLLFTLPVIAQYNENLIKAAYIERISRFIEWPVRDSIQYHNSFVIGVYEDEEFYNVLQEIFRNKTIKERKVTVKLVKNPEEIAGCNICYISKKARPIISKFVISVKSSGVLLMSATPDFGSAGVHINFYLEDEKLKFEINERSMVAAGLKASYLLMQNIRIIK